MFGNKSGCWRLKLIVETELIHKHFTAHSVLDFLLFADGQGCSMLKELCLKTICMVRRGVISILDGWQQMPESKDLLVEIVKAKNGDI